MNRFDLTDVVFHGGKLYFEPFNRIRIKGIYRGAMYCKDHLQTRKLTGLLWRFLPIKKCSHSLG